MTRTIAEKRAAFRDLHKEGCFVIPNPWDAGSARMLQHLGFRALASTSAGLAWSTGHPDYAITRDTVLEHLAAVSQAVDIPLNADFESGFAANPDGVAENVTLAIRAGVAGLSIEDRRFGGNGLYDLSSALERIRAAQRAIDSSGHDVLLIARTELLLSEPKAIGPAIDKLVAFADAGADCLFAPGVRDQADIAAIVKAVSPKPVNVLMMGPGLSVAQLTDLGVRRISVGGAMARVAWAAIIATAEKMSAGSFDGLEGGAPRTKLNEVFGGFG